MLITMIDIGGCNGAALRSEVAARIGERTLQAALASGLLTQIWRGVIVPGVGALDVRTRAAAALLVAGQHAVLSGCTALALHGLTAVETEKIHVTVPYARSVRSRTALIVHHHELAEADVQQLGGLAVHRLDLAMADYLCRGPKRTAFAAWDEALARLPTEQGLTLRNHVDQRLEIRPDRRGVVKAKMLLDLATGKADSPPESIFRLLVAEAGFPIPEAQYPICTIDGRELYRLDMAWPTLRIALEYDGYAAHEARGEYDTERDTRLRGRGWIVIRATAEDLADPQRVLGELKVAFARRSG
jgi:Protein of unknown function (DUF559)